MKKTFAIFVVVCMVLSLLLCSCSTDIANNGLSENDSTLLTVTFSDGSTKNMSVKELIYLYENDGRKFEEIKLIKGEGKVTDVGSIEQANWDYDTKRPTAWDVDVKIGKDIVLSMFVNSPSDVPQLYNGDIIEFSGACGGVTEFDKIYVSYHYQIEGHYVNLKK